MSFIEWWKNTDAFRDIPRGSSMRLRVKTITRSAYEAGKRDGCKRTAWVLRHSETGRKAG